MWSSGLGGCCATRPWRPGSCRAWLDRTSSGVCTLGWPRSCVVGLDRSDGLARFGIGQALGLIQTTRHRLSSFPLQSLPIQGVQGRTDKEC
jgi:hypothetical protein